MANITLDRKDRHQTYSISSSLCDFVVRMFSPKLNFVHNLSTSFNIQMRLTTEFNIVKLCCIKMLTTFGRSLRGWFRSTGGRVDVRLSFLFSTTMLLYPEVEEKLSVSQLNSESWVISVMVKIISSYWWDWVYIMHEVVFPIRSSLNWCHNTTDYLWDWRGGGGWMGK